MEVSGGACPWLREPPVPRLTGTCGVGRPIWREEPAGAGARRAMARETGGWALPTLNKWDMSPTCIFTGLSLCVLNDVGKGQKEARECS